LRALYREQINEEGFLLMEKDSINYRKTVFPLSDILQVKQAQIQVTIGTPLFLAYVSKPVLERMIHDSNMTIFVTTHPPPSFFYS
jgi:hypothetical protein